MKREKKYYLPDIDAIIGAILFVGFLALAMSYSESHGDTEFDERANGYTGYDYDRKAWVDVDQDPAGGYDGYDYQTREHFTIEPNEAGGFTIYRGDND